MKTCPDCGLPEERKKDARGREVTNLEPLSGRCLGCLGREALKRHTFHSRREDRKGQVIDTKDLPFDGRAAAARNDE